FSNNGAMSGITHTPGTTSFVVPTSGTYAIDYSINVVGSGGEAIAIAVNGNVQSSTLVDDLSGFGYLGGRAVLALNAGDVVTLRNNGPSTVTIDSSPGVGAQLNITAVNASAI
ncbi:MAG TPA: hypothetical protein V6D47_05070, partial [Oscillatoriaceae cyanobacterium]